ncbi:MAG: protein kinase [Candidatus Parcubacteria bacterium]|nr:protein kinase [Candidatus Parcubacteria bacterium]
MGEITKIVPSEALSSSEVENEKKVVVAMAGAFLKAVNQRFNIGSGSIAEVYMADWQGYAYCVKREEHQSPKKAYSKKMEQELDLQAQAFLLVKQRQAEGKPVALVPLPSFYIETSDGNKVLIMHRIEAKTLYRLMLEEVAKTIPADKIRDLLPGVTNFDVAVWPDNDLEELVIEGFYQAKTKRADMTEVQLEDYLKKRIFNTLKNKKFLPKIIMQQIANTLDVWKKNQFHHRDLHEKNIMISADLSQAYIIDFGTASYKEFERSEDAYDVQIMGENVMFFRDEGIFYTLDRLVKD